MSVSMMPAKWTIIVRLLDTDLFGCWLTLLFVDGLLDLLNEDTE